MKKSKGTTNLMKNKTAKKKKKKICKTGRGVEN